LINIPIDLHGFVESLMANVFIADKDFNIIFMNACARKSLKAVEPTLQDLFKINIDDILGESIHRFHRDPGKVESILTNPSMLPHQAEFEFGGITLRSEINAFPDKTGKLAGYVVNWADVTESTSLGKDLNIKLKELHDVNKKLLKHTRQIEQDEIELKEVYTEQHKMHAYLNIKLAELKQSNQDLESFATIASHDLMAPVRKIINFTDTLLESGTSFTKDDEFILDKILRAGKKMHLLIDDILEYSRLAGHSVTFDRVNLNDVMSEVKAVLSDQIMAVNGEVESESLPIIEANKTQMVQLLQNLISNSLKYRKENIPPAVKISSTVGDEGFITICLKDNGMGIKDEYADLVFQPFERLNPQIEGTGMGLAICKKVVVSHGGDIAVKSLPDDGGSVFNIKLPERHGK
jgi:signal transduction histidine kinase